MFVYVEVQPVLTTAALYDHEPVAGISGTHTKTIYICEGLKTFLFTDLSLKRGEGGFWEAYMAVSLQESAQKHILFIYVHQNWGGGSKDGAKSRFFYPSPISKYLKDGYHVTL